MMKEKRQVLPMKEKKYSPAPDRYEKTPYRHAGRSGLRLPLVSLGLWHNFGSVDDFSAMREMIFTAFDNGVTMFDIANNYGPAAGSAETNFGKILRGDLKGHRDELLISTKAGFDMWEGPYGNFGSLKYLTASLDQSLKRMKLDYVDIFYHHRPDPDTPVEESCYALYRAVQSGKALYAGISNYNREQTRRAVAVLRELKCPFVLDQICYNLFNRWPETDGLKDYAREEGFGLIAYSPLAQGLLTDRYREGVPEGSRVTKNKFLKKEALTPEWEKRTNRLREIAAARGQSLAQLALSWLLKDDCVTSVIIGASSPAQILENLCVNPSFTQEELTAIDEACGI